MRTHNMSVEVVPHHHIDGLGYLGPKRANYLRDCISPYPRLIASPISDGSHGCGIADSHTW